MTARLKLLIDMDISCMLSEVMLWRTFLFWLLMWWNWGFVLINVCNVEFYVSFHTESNIEDRNRELKVKDESFARMEKLIQEKSDAIAVLQSNVDLLQVWLWHHTCICQIPLFLFIDFHSQEFLDFWSLIICWLLTFPCSFVLSINILCMFLPLSLEP